MLPLPSAHPSQPEYGSNASGSFLAAEETLHYNADSARHSVAVQEIAVRHILGKIVQLQGVATTRDEFSELGAEYERLIRIFEGKPSGFSLRGYIDDRHVVGRAFVSASLECLSVDKEGRFFAYGGGSLSGSQGVVGLHALPFHTSEHQSFPSILITDSVTSLQLSPDGLLLALGGQEGLQLLKIDKASMTVSSDESPSLGRRITGAVSSVAFSNDGSLLAVGTFDSQVFLYAVPMLHEGTLQELSRVSLPHGVTAIAFSENDAMLGVGTFAGEMILLSLDSLGHLEPVAMHLSGAPIMCVSFSPVAPVVAFGGQDYHMRLFSYTTDAHKTEAAMTSLAWHRSEGHVHALSFSPDGDLLAIASENRVYIVSMYGNVGQDAEHSSGNLPSFFPDLDPAQSLPIVASVCVGSKYRNASLSTLTFTPDGTCLILGYSNGEILTIGAHPTDEELDLQYDSVQTRS